LKIFQGFDELDKPSTKQKKILNVHGVLVKIAMNYLRVTSTVSTVGCAANLKSRSPLVRQKGRWKYQGMTLERK
jgi:hypothetical protein